MNIAVLIATHNRPLLLAERSLPSVSRQTHSPDLLVLVDDSHLDCRRDNRAALEQIGSPVTRTIYLENRRTPGASGAWNTGLAWLHRNYPNCYLAILDDDDAWEAAYLEKCTHQVTAAGLDMTAAGLILHRHPHRKGVQLAIPSYLDAADFLVGNPHIQGSNLFIRLDAILAAGGFDEALSSTTDRDLCIRLADLPKLTFAALPEHLVHHYADEGRPRLSHPGSIAKKIGLHWFYDKYQGRMSRTQRAAFCARAAAWFGIKISDARVAITSQPPTHPMAQQLPANEDELRLLIGIITSPHVWQVANLLDDICTLFLGSAGVQVSTLLLVNDGNTEGSSNRLTEVVARSVNRGLSVSVVTSDEGWNTGAARASIAAARTDLQRRLYDMAKSHPGTVVWILDDDVRLRSLVADFDGLPCIVHPDYPSLIRNLRKTGIPIVIGNVVGDPPLPAAATIRVQLVDLLHNLVWLKRLHPDEPFPLRGINNDQVRRHCVEYYYDFSRDYTAHLEYPFWYIPDAPNITVGEVFVEMTCNLYRMNIGGQVFRPIIMPSETSLLSAPSISRGPNTLIYDINALRDVPNITLQANGREVRRSDMVWSLLNRWVAGRNIMRSYLPVQQTRRIKRMDGPDFDQLADDILGHGFYSTLRDLLAEKSTQRNHARRSAHGEILLDFTAVELDLAAVQFAKYLDERLTTFEMNALRIRGLLGILRRYTDPAVGCCWWLTDSRYAAAVDDLRGIIHGLERSYISLDLEQFRRKIEAVDAPAVKAALSGLAERLSQHRRNTPLPVAAIERRAREFIEGEFTTGVLRLLGVGEEGISFTDGQLAYKYFHYSPPAERARQTEFLASLPGSWVQYETLPDVCALRVRGDEMVLAYRHRPGSLYAGDRLGAILRFLHECRAAGIVCRNVRPKNFVSVGDGILLVDIGRDVRPYNEIGYLQMCRRAFLMYRFHFRSDLASLMRTSIETDDLPEMFGFEHFQRALTPRTKDEILDARLFHYASKNADGSIIDYGCGTGNLAETLARKGARVTAYDPDPTTFARNYSTGSAVEYLDEAGKNDLLASGRQYNLTICSLVLCVLETPAEMDAVLADLRLLTKDDGIVLVAVCNPFNIATPSTELHEWPPASRREYHRSATHEKRIVATGRVRRDVHRPLSEYRRAFCKTGFIVREMIETDGTDTANLRPASDFLLFRLEPGPQSTNKDDHASYEEAYPASNHYPPRRDESFVFVVCGRAVNLMQFKQCWASIVCQQRDDWGAILIDDASDNGLSEYMAFLSHTLRERITLVRNRESKGLLQSRLDSIQHYCANPESVIILMDADNALLTHHALSCIAREYERGADATSCAILRLDIDPRDNCSSGVRRHLCTFKRRLFDRIIEEDDLTIEMAERPAYILESLYL